MFTYRIFQRVLATEATLPELTQIQRSEPDIRVEFSRARPALAVAEWTQIWRSPAGQQTVALFAGEHEYLLRFPGLADFFVSRKLDAIRCQPLDIVPAETLRHLLLDQVVPRVVGQSGDLVLHASAVETTDGKLIAFVGETGWGKSTLAAAMASVGAVLRSDDALLVREREGRICGTPSYPGSRLYDDSLAVLAGVKRQSSRARVAHYTSKARVQMERGEDGSCQDRPIRAIFALSSPLANAGGGEIAVAPIAGVAELMPLAGQQFLLDPRDAEARRFHFQHMQLLLNAGLPLFSLGYPRRYDHLQAVVSRVLESC